MTSALAPVTGVMLAGGRASRMGGRDKAFAAGLNNTVTANDLMIVLREYEDFYNTQRPHRTLKQAAPLRPLPDGVADLAWSAGEYPDPARVFVARSQFPKPGEDEFYWADLVGLDARDLDAASRTMHATPLAYLQGEGYFTPPPPPKPRRPCPRTTTCRRRSPSARSTR